MAAVCPPAEATEAASGILESRPKSPLRLAPNVLCPILELISIQGWGGTNSSGGPIQHGTPTRFENFLQFALEPCIKLSSPVPQLNQDNHENLVWPPRTAGAQLPQWQSLCRPFSFSYQFLVFRSSLPLSHSLESPKLVSQKEGRFSELRVASSGENASAHRLSVRLNWRTAL